MAAVLRWSVVLAIWGMLALGGLVAYYAWDLPDVQAALDATRRPTVQVLDQGGREIAAFGDLYGDVVPVSAMPAALPRAVIATEDRGFYDHPGLDVLGVARAMVANLRAGGVVQGGSTITQQVAKNLFLSPERSIKRKVQELLLAFWLESRFTKDQILTLYLNRVYLGAGTYGVEAAARRYFGKPVSALTVYESAMIAGLLKAPSRYNPAHDPQAARDRTKVVLSGMVAAGYLTADQRAQALAGGTGIGTRAGGGRVGRYFAGWVEAQLDGYVGQADSDLVVRTTLDSGLQASAERALRGLLESEGAQAGVTQGAVVVMRPDGAVAALVGGRDWRSSPFNRATQARRQPGSAFKPFVYLAALESGMSPVTMIEDAPITVDGWSPGNFDGRYLGPVNLSRALAQSINTVAVRLSERVGRERVARVAERLGIPGPIPSSQPSIALGTHEVSLMDLTAAYAAFASGGQGVWPHGITRIAPRAGDALFVRSGQGPGQVVEPADLAALNRMLEGVVTRGTGRNAGIGRPVGGKTGTSQGFRDAWFVGFTADYVAGVWLGNDDGRPMDKVTGGGLAAKLWARIMTEAHEGLPARPLPGTEAPPTRDRSLGDFIRDLLGQ